MTMIKKFLILLLAVMPFVAQAQFNEGQWVTHYRFSMTSAQNVIDTDSKVYYLVNNCLYCFDKTAKTTTPLSNMNSLSGSLITGIYYNYDKKYLVVTYEDSNIDIVQDNGKVVNISNIKDAVMTQKKTINDITFNDGKMYIATGFGYAVVDDSDFQMTEAHNLSINAISAFIVGDYLMVFDSNKNFLYYSSKNKPIESTAQTLYAATIYNGKLIAVNDTTFVVSQPTQGKLKKCSFHKGTNGRLEITQTNVADIYAEHIQPIPQGYIANVLSGKFYFTFNKNFETLDYVECGEELYSCCPTGNGTMWSVNENGLHQSGNTSTYYKPDAVSIKEVPFWMGYNKRFHKLYLMSTSDNGILQTANNTALYEANTYDGTTWKNADPTGTSGTQGWYWPVFDPNDETDTYYIATRLYGVFKVTNNAVALFMDGRNTPNVSRKACMDFDSQGNLWMVHSSLSNSVPVKVLPKDKLHSSFAVSDWTIYPISDVVNTNTFKFSTFAITKDGKDIKSFCTGSYGCPLIMWRNDADVTKRQYESKTYSSLNTKEGATCTWNYAYAMKADLTGNILFGTDKSLLFFKGEDAFSDDFGVDNISDFDGTTVYCIEVDTLNRKWVGTLGDGLYLLSPDCKTVIKHFTSNNSSLTTNVIYNLCCNTDDNSIFIVTPLGIQQYFSDYTPSESDFSNVKAYPNPVRPDFTGYITISGLMSNSTVVIKDKAGNTVKTLSSNGGLAIWDGTNNANQKVPTGSYSVFAAQNGAAMPASPYTKVNVIR